MAFPEAIIIRLRGFHGGISSSILALTYTLLTKIYEVFQNRFTIPQMFQNHSNDLDVIFPFFEFTVCEDAYYFAHQGEMYISANGKASLLLSSIKRAYYDHHCIEGIGFVDPLPVHLRA